MAKTGKGKQASRLGAPPLWVTKDISPTNRANAAAPSDVPRFLRYADFAALLGVHERTVKRYVSHGMPALGAAGHARPVDVQKAIDWLGHQHLKRRGRPRNIDRLPTARGLEAQS